MCNFFSLVSDGNGKIYYFDWKIRKQIIKDELNYEHDSHTSIADYYGFKGKHEDKLNKYEYNPLTHEFKIDQLNTTDDSKIVETFCKKLDFKTIIPVLNIKPIINPFELPIIEHVTKKDISLLKQWASVRASVWACVGSYFNLSKWKGVEYEKDKYPFQSCVDLWMRGLVPSFDGTIWRLHTGPKAKVVFEIKL